MEKLLPLGSIVVLNNGTKKLMIYGRLQKQVGTEKIWDYISCLYPEGNISDKYTFLFNQEDIREVIHKGYEDEEEMKFQGVINEKRGV